MRLLNLQIPLNCIESRYRAQNYFIYAKIRLINLKIRRAHVNEKSFPCKLLRAI